MSLMATALESPRDFMMNGVLAPCNDFHLADAVHAENACAAVHPQWNRCTDGNTQAAVESHVCKIMHVSTSIYYMQQGWLCT